jgi:hypothetical protein
MTPLEYLRGHMTPLEYLREQWPVPSPEQYRVAREYLENMVNGRPQLVPTDPPEPPPAKLKKLSAKEREHRVRGAAMASRLAELEASPAWLAIMKYNVLTFGMPQEVRRGIYPLSDAFIVLVDGITSKTSKQALARVRAGPYPATDELLRMYKELEARDVSETEAKTKGLLLRRTTGFDQSWRSDLAIWCWVHAHMQQQFCPLSPAQKRVQRQQIKAMFTRAVIAKGWRNGVPVEKVKERIVAKGLYPSLEALDKHLETYLTEAPILG